jgi:CRISPR-associated endonuclease/helicase Cas3
MCAEHRLHVIGEIKDPREGSIRDRLKRGLPCRVVATQVVEAGVDLDFPVVYRALGPLDSIVQAAGRCNREGRLTRGEVFIFTPAEHSLPSGIYKTATSQTAVFLDGASLDKLGTEPKAFGDYFSQLYQLTDTDARNIMEERKSLHFREVAGKAKVIEDDGIAVVVPYGKGKEVIEEIRTRTHGVGQPRFDRHDLRRLQRFMINVRQRDFVSLQANRMVKPLLPNLELYVVEESCYDDKWNLGLLIERRPLEDLCGA